MNDDTPVRSMDDRKGLMLHLITVRTDDWVGAFDAVRAPCKALSDGMRYRSYPLRVGDDPVRAA